MSGSPNVIRHALSYQLSINIIERCIRADGSGKQQHGEKKTNKADERNKGCNTLTP
jgi:hypothetical protein